jgi:acetyl esterase/lipase
MLFGLPLDNAAFPPEDPNGVYHPPLSVLDIVAFLRALVPVLVHTIPPLTLLSALLTTALFAFSLPFSLVLTRTRLVRTPYPNPQPSLLQDIVIRLVRHAFAHFPHTVGRAFFSEDASVPLAVRRLGGTDKFEERCVRVCEDTEGVEGWWVATHGAGTLAKGTESEEERPDVTVLYTHGGGLSMGSPAFYLPFLHALVRELRAQGFARPAVFAPAYGLVPEARFPTQLEDVRRAWAYVVRRAAPGAKVGVAGDSAGAGLVLGMVLQLADAHDIRKPDFAVCALFFGCPQILVR